MRTFRERDEEWLGNEGKETFAAVVFECAAMVQTFSNFYQDQPLAKDYDVAVRVQAVAKDFQERSDNIQQLSFDDKVGFLGFLYLESNKCERNFFSQYSKNTLLRNHLQDLVKRALNLYQDSALYSKVGLVPRGGNAQEHSQLENRFDNTYKEILTSDSSFFKKMKNTVATKVVEATGIEGCYPVQVTNFYSNYVNFEQQIQCEIELKDYTNTTFKV